MFNYIKWELMNFFSSKIKFFVAIGVVYFLALVVSFDYDGFFTRLIVLAIFIAAYLSLFGTYYMGTSYAVNTFSNKTFLLESMIPLSEKKILLAKYILGEIINFVFGILTIIAFLIILIKDVGLGAAMEDIQTFVENMNVLNFLKIGGLLLYSSMAFMSLVILCFVVAKVINPGSKHEKIIGFILAFIGTYTILYIVIKLFGESNILPLYLILICITIICFYSTSYLVKEKLEVY